MSDEYGYYEERRLGRRLAAGGVVAIVVAAGYLGVTQLGAAAGNDVNRSADAGSSIGIATPPTTITSTTTTAPPATSGPAPEPSTAPARTAASPSTTTTTSATSTTTTTPATSTTTSTSTSATSTTTPTPTSSPGPVAPSNTLPDGSPVPVVAIFDVDTITLAGAVPTRAAADRLTMLAQANSKTPAAVIDLLTIDPGVPIGVGVRVVELNSSRFPAGTATITLSHGAELQRMVAVMAALPKVTALVVGHADQIGSDTANMELSEQRAQAVVEFMVDQGVAPDRLAARAVGETDLLSLSDDDAALALNRRTEFVVYGALIQ